jgi:hypothetical protein
VIIEETPLSEGTRFYTICSAVRVYYVLHQLPTKNWVLINEENGCIWYNPSTYFNTPIDAFGGWEDEFHQAY